MTSKLRALFRDCSGNIATVSAMVLPLLLGAGAYATDYAIMYHQKSALQEAADAAALASVKELGLVGADEDLISAVANSYVHSIFDNSSTINNGKTELEIIATPSKENSQVKIDLSYTWTPFLAHLFDYRVTPIKVSATGALAGQSLTCIVGLMEPQRLAKASIHLDDRSLVQANDCAVFSNSTSRYGLRADGSSEMNAGSICSAGGVLQFGGTAKFTPNPITDCPKIEDPLIDRPAPAVMACRYNAMEVNTDTVLRPGVYCGGLTISGSARITLEPGVYVIKDGPLIVKDTAAITGQKITFFLTGEDSVFDFQDNTTIDLSAAETGTTAGILFYEDRSVDYSFDFNPFFLNNLPRNVRLHKISSNDARNLLGTLYLSRSILLIDSDAPVADNSAYTAIITGRLWLKEGPTLTLNSDYTDTTVPVPNGLLGTTPRLHN